MRDLHDGAQQRLVHTMMTLELAHGILPSVLTHGGLRASIDALAARMPATVETDVPSMRLAPAVEATAYFVTAEIPLAPTL